MNTEIRDEEYGLGQVVDPGDKTPDPELVLALALEVTLVEEPPSELYPAMQRTETPKLGVRPGGTHLSKFFFQDPGEADPLMKILVTDDTIVPDKLKDYL